MKCNGFLLDFSSPKVMGIINYTPDSFYDGGKYKAQTEILNQVEKMLADGASIIDVGAYSSRPNSDYVSEYEELRRLLPVVKSLVATFPKAVFSVDTFRASIAYAAVQEGVHIVNDISAGLLDEKMLETVAELKVPYCMMHLKGTPQTMMQNTLYDDLVIEILYYFSKQLHLARSFGITDFIIDPGFGFSKTVDQNFEILQKLDFFKILELPILAGISRKSMIYKTLETTPEFALNGTSVLNTIALQNGAKILRVHDVKEAMECVKLTSKLK